MLKLRRTLALKMAFLAPLAIIALTLADSGGWRSAFRTDVDHDSEVMAISIPSRSRSVLRL
jgi:hypothetical protein